MELQSTLERYAVQLKNVPRTLVSVAGVVQKMMKTLYDAHFPDAENHRPRAQPGLSRQRHSHDRVALGIHRGRQRTWLDIGGSRQPNCDPFFRAYPKGRAPIDADAISGGPVKASVGL